jgi:hypothetical protein
VTHSRNFSRATEIQFKILPIDDICDFSTHNNSQHLTNLITKSQTWRTIRVNSSTCKFSPHTPSLPTILFCKPSKSTQLDANCPPHTATSPANAAPPTASSKPKTTPRYKSPSARSTRTAATRARTKCMRCAASCAPWARVMIR